MRTERNVMIAASRSRPECNASERTPKLPVRTTKNVLRETNRRAEPTLRSAARFFSRPSSTWLIVVIACLDYLNSPYSPERAALLPPALQISSRTGISRSCYRFIARYLPAKLRRCIFSPGTRRHPYDSPCLLPDRSCITFCDLHSRASSRPVAGSERVEHIVQSGDGSRKVCAHRERGDRPRSRAHHSA